MDVKVWLELVRDVFLSLAICLETVAPEDVSTGVYAPFYRNNCAELILLDSKSLGCRSLKFCFRYFAAHFHGQFELFHRKSAIRETGAMSSGVLTPALYWNQPATAIIAALSVVNLNSGR